MEERKGFFTPEQEQILDDLYDAKGILEALDGTGIRLADNVGLEKLKKNTPPEILPTLYEVIDQIFIAIKPIAEEK